VIDFPPGPILVRIPNWIGDAVMSSAAVRAIRSHCPNRKLILVAKPWVADLYSRSPIIDEIIRYDHRRGPGRVIDLAQVVTRIRSEGPAGAVLLQTAFESALMTFLAGIPIRTGLPTDRRGMFLSHPLRLDPSIRSRHLVEEYLAIVDAVFGPSSTPPPLPSVDLSEEDRARARDQISGASPIRIALAPGAAYGSAKRWPSVLFGKLSGILSRDLNATVFLMGGAGELPIMNAIRRESGDTARIIAGTCDLMTQAAIIEACDVCVANDSGLLHLAAALKTPVIGIFGPTDASRTRPYGDRHRVLSEPLDCAPCHQKECPIDHRCMLRITPERVFREIQNIIEK